MRDESQQMYRLPFSFSDEIRLLKRHKAISIATCMACMRQINDPLPMAFMAIWLLGIWSKFHNNKLLNITGNYSQFTVLGLTPMLISSRKKVI